MRISREEYAQLVRQSAPRSRLGLDIVRAFVTGGLICCVGELLGTLYGAMGLTEELASTAVSVTLIALAALLTGLGWYDDMARFAGAGTLVPITGFANAVVSPALEFKTEGFILGTAARLFTIAGPVLAFGLSAATLYGLILCLVAAL